MKRWHEKHIHRREFQVGDLVLLFKSNLNLPRKLYLRQSGPLKAKKVFLYCAIKVGTKAMGNFEVNGSLLKHYITGESINGKVTHDLPDVVSP